jgi:SulP family sulfate permease
LDVVRRTLYDAPMTARFHPKLLTCLRDNYDLPAFRADVVAALTVAIVALPLAMALGIASGATPEQGLITVVVAGLLISLLGGSRLQIGGPTGAFVVIVYDVIEKHGYDGLLVATLMAGGMLVLAGILKLGTYIRHIPATVVTGFTCGIAIIIASSQVRDLFGLTMEKLPGDFIEKWAAFWDARGTFNFAALALAAAGLGIIIALRRYAPKIPAFLVAVVAASLAAMLFSLPVETIGTMFGGIPRAIPAPRLPDIAHADVAALLPSAFAIAFLAGIESLLSAVVADRMTGHKHRSNTELVAQGIANTASALFGGLPATGAIARTATNIRAGARTPVAGVLHALFVLAFMLLLAPLASYIPLAALAAVLLVVAWGMSERKHAAEILRGAWAGRIVMLTTLVLTVAVDLTLAITGGVILSLLLERLRSAQAPRI